MSSGLYQIRDKDLDTTLDLTRIKPYGDTMNDGKVQTSFTLPVKDDDRGAAAAVLIAQKMGLADPNVALRQKLDENFTFYVVYGSLTHTINYNEIVVQTVTDETMDMHENDEYLKEHLGRKMVVVGASTGTDAHTVGIDAIMNRKGFAGHYGLERYEMVEAYNLGSQVPNEEFLRKADYIAVTEGTRTYPWRVVTVDEDDRALLENYLPYQLASKAVEGDASWVRPGKISWDWWNGLNVYGVDFEAGVNTATYKYFIDFAARYGLEYILLDEGWSVSTLNIREPRREVDLKEIVRYGNEKGVGVILWTLWNPMKKDLTGILDTYRDWGVKGIKIDFMQRSDQEMVNFYEQIARAAYDRGLLVDFHGSFKPAGLQRKYPNVLSFEGVYGMENDKCSKDITPAHDCVLPFTRMVAGPMDYTPGATVNATAADFSVSWSHPMSQGTRAHQAALYVIYESPLQMLCDSPSHYLRTPEFTGFIAAVPTVWDQTAALHASAGEYAAVARRNGDRWYIGAITDWTGRDMEIDLSFLGEGRYRMQYFADGVNADSYAQDFRTGEREVTREDKLNVRLASGGGWAAILTPVK